MGIVIRFPTLYRIAWTDGEREGLLDGYEFRNKRTAETVCHRLQDSCTTLMLWVQPVGPNASPQDGPLPPLPPAAA